MNEASPDRAADQETPEQSAEHIQRQHLRGSSLMVVGRVVSMGLNLFVQVLAVRYLGKADYGAFAYALTISALATNVVLLGQDQALGRFLPRFQEEGRSSLAEGALVVAFTTVFGLGAAVAALVIGLHAVGVDLTSDDEAAAVLVVLIALAPLVAFDELFQNLFAAVAKPTAIFFRRHIVTPGLRLASVLLVMATAGDVENLAWAYLVSGLFGVLLYVAFLWKVMRENPFFTRATGERTYPMGAMLRFGAPVYVSVLLKVTQTTMVVVLLEALKSLEAVGAFRAVLPVAQVNTVGIQSFRLLYLPMVSRLMASHDDRSVGVLYWQSASWLAVGTFPIFVLTFSFAGPLTTVLFGDEFADSAGILAVLSLGFYLSSTLGLNTHTLRASGNVHLLLVIGVVCTVVGAGLSIVLIHTRGAFGAAIATSATIVVQNVLTHLALQHTLDGMHFPRRLRHTYLSIGAAGILLTLMQRVIEPSLSVSVPVAAAVTLLVLLLNRDALDIGDALPEARRIPVLRWFVS